MQIELNTTVCVSLNNNESPFDAQERLQTVLSENNMSAIKTDNIVLHDDKGTPLHFYELWCQEHETPGGINDFDMSDFGFEIARAGFYIPVVDKNGNKLPDLHLRIEKNIDSSTGIRPVYAD